MGLIAKPEAGSQPDAGRSPASVSRSSRRAGEGWITTRLDFLVNWGRSNSLWPMPFGTACCAIEFMATAASKFDLARFGMERMSFSPRQSDVLICAGRVPFKLAPVIRRIWQQMPQPKWAISMGACASTGGMFDNYAVVQGIDTIIPVDVYVPGCPPRPEGLIYGIMMLQKKIMTGAHVEPVAARRDGAGSRRPSSSSPRRASTSSPSRSATRSTRRDRRRDQVRNRESPAPATRPSR